MDIASVIVTPVLTCRVLARSILDSRLDLPAFCLSRATHENVSFFLFNRFRTLCPLFGASAFDNSFGIRLFRTLLQKPGVGTPLRVTREPRSPRGCCLAVIDPLSSCWGPVVFQREMPSISFPFMPLRDSFHHNEGGYTPLPSCPLLFPANLRSVPPCLCGYLSPLPRRELLCDLCYSSSPQRSSQR
jgi:hypothetical protein